MAEETAENSLPCRVHPVDENASSSDAHHTLPHRDCTDEGTQLRDEGSSGDDEESVDESQQECLLIPGYGSRSVGLSSSWISILQDGNKKYPLREMNYKNFRGSSWIDTDESGDYDPSNEHKRVARPPLISKRALLVINENSDELPESKRHQPRATTYEYGRQIGRSHIKTPPSTSTDGHENLRDFATNHTSPKSYGDAEEIFESNIYMLPSSPAKNAGIVTREKISPDQAYIHESLAERSEEDYGQTSSGSVACSCRKCHQLGIECSLIDDGLSCPCRSCYKNNYDCILVRTPSLKDRCERCELRELECVYGEKGGAGHKSCENCELAKVVCIVKPAKPSCKDGEVASENSKTGNSLTEKKRCINCLNCRKQKAYCSVRSRDDDGPCKRCVSKGLSCTFEAITRPRILRKQKNPNAQMYVGGARKGHTPCELATKKQKKLFHQAMRRSSRLEFTEPAFESTINGGKIKQITTSYCHPISFNWEPPPPLPPSPYSDRSASSATTSAFPCHFCTHPGLPYALVGLGSQVVEVIEWDEQPNAGYEELENGWSSRGEETTRMCRACTTERMLICACAGHEIRRIEGLDPRTFDIQAALEGVVFRMTERNGKERMPDDGTKWCSVCIMPAFFECCVRPRFDKHCRPTSLMDDIGCGLLLCEVCAFRMKGSRPGSLSSVFKDCTNDNTTGEQANGILSRLDAVKAVLSLDEHIATAAQDEFNYPDGLRADVSFLTSNGELMKRLVMVSKGTKRGGSPESQETRKEAKFRSRSRGFKKSSWEMSNFIDLTEE